jgi:hypothetical protein
MAFNLDRYLSDSGLELEPPLSDEALSPGICEVISVGACDAVRSYRSVSPLLMKWILFSATRTRTTNGWMADCRRSIRSTTS